MTTTVESPGSTANEAEAAALAERMFGAALGAIDLLTMYLGVRLGLYAALAAEGTCTSDRLAERAGIAPRYAREWLEQQTVTGVVHCPDRTVDAAQRRYTLPPGHQVVLLDPESPASMAPLTLALAGIAGVLPQLLEAYRTGGGVPYAAYGADFRDGQAGFNRPAFAHLLAGPWLETAVPELHARLGHGEAVRVADVACGAGWSSIALATAYPSLRVDGFDLDEASVADARRNAADAAVADRVSFEVADAASLPAGTYDLVCVFEALHDMSRPVEVLTALRRLRAEGGQVLVMDEKVADTFAGSDGPIDAFIYGASVLHCLPVGLAEPASAGTGAVMRLDTVREYAAAAGFTAADVLPIEHDLFRFYRFV